MRPLQTTIKSCWSHCINCNTLYVFIVCFLPESLSEIGQFMRISIIFIFKFPDEGQPSKLQISYSNKKETPLELVRIVTKCGRFSAKVFFVETHTLMVIFWENRLVFVSVSLWPFNGSHLIGCWHQGKSLDPLKSWWIFRILHLERKLLNQGRWEKK